MAARKLAGALTIGALADRTGCKVETIRYYERIGVFPAPSRSNGNYRIYTADHLRRLAFIRKSRSLGFTMAEVRELLRLADQKDRDCAAVDTIARAHLAEIDQKIAELRALGRELRFMIARCARGRIAECRIIEALSALQAGSSSLA